MTIEHQERKVRRPPLTFTVPACGFVVAARSKQFQLTEPTSEQVNFLDTRWLATFRCETNQEQTLREPDHQTAL